MANSILETPKINKLRKLPGGDAYVIIFMKMMMRSREDGLVCNGANYQGFVDLIGEEYEMFILAIAILREMCMIRLNDNEDVYIPKELLFDNKT